MKRIDLLLVFETAGKVRTYAASAVTYVKITDE